MQIRSFNVLKMRVCCKFEEAVFTVWKHRKFIPLIILQNLMDK